MEYTMAFRRISTVFAFAVSAAVLAACGGGGTHSTLPPTSSNSNSKSGGSSTAMSSSRATVLIPTAVLQAAAARLSADKKKPNYINTQDPTSSMVVSVTPADPAEQSQWATLYGTSGFSLCTNLIGPSFTPQVNGVNVNPALNPTAVAGGINVTIPMPAPPGNDAFVFSQYDGACSSTNPYAPPSPSPNANGTGLLAQTQALDVYIQPGTTNAFNVEVAFCLANNTNGVCSNTPASGPGATITLGASISAVSLGGNPSPAPKSLAAAVPLPIPEPVRETAGFGAKSIGIPIPVVGLDSNGYVIPGSPALPGPPVTLVSGFLPLATDSITLTHTETGPSGAVTGNAELFVIDAATSAIAQNDSGGSIVLHDVNILGSNNSASLLPAGTPLVKDNILGGTLGDPYVVVLDYNGTSSQTLTSMTVKMVAVVNGVSTTQTLTIQPQAALYSATSPANAPTSGYADPAAYVAPAQILPIAGGTIAGIAAQSLWVADGTGISQVGKAHVNLAPAAGAAAALGGLAFDGDAGVKGFISTDYSVAKGSLQTTPSATPVSSGLFYYDPTAVQPTYPIAVVLSGNYIGFQHPQGVVWTGQAYPNDYVYVAENNNIWAIDPTNNGTGFNTTTSGANTYYLADADAGKLTYAAGVTVPNFTTGTTLPSGAVGMITDGSGNLILADTGNNRIISIKPVLPQNGTSTITVIASGHPFNSVTASGTAGSYYATDTTGAVYLVSSSSTQSYGIPVAAAGTDGPAGVLTLATSPTTGVPSLYALAGQNANFFGGAPTLTVPYTLAPFGAPLTPATAVFANTATATTALNLAADTSNGGFAGVTVAGALNKSTVVGAYGVSAAAATAINTADANTALTGNSVLISSGATMHTLVY